MESSEEDDFTNATELFEQKLFPESIIIGMPSNEFWNGKPSWFLSYIEAYRLRQERQEEVDSVLVDYQSWLTGLYVYQGVQVALANSFSKKSHAKYVKEPISFKQKRENSKETKEQEEQRIENEYLQFKMLTDAMNKNKANKR